jgi:16S rRNA G966 N2-methylase RsmD
MNQYENITIDPEFAALIPPLSKEERDQLEANLLEHGGARDALVVWNVEDRLILIDGHNRLEICMRLGLLFDIEEIEFDDRNHAKEWIIRNQFGRRNMSAYVRTQLALQLEETIAARAKGRQLASLKKGDVFPVCQNSDKRESIDTKREVAKLANVSHDTVAKVKVIDAAEKAGKIDVETVNKLRNGEVSINRIVRDLKEQETSAKREEQKAVAILNRQSVDGLYLGDFREIGHKIPDASVDLIFTDPPYDRKAIELYDGLGEFAARVLRPGGSLIAYVGQIQLPDAIADLSRHLRYWWTCSCYHSGPTLLRMTEYGIVNGWKPMLWFVKETRGDKTTFINDVATGSKEKSHHEWQQSEAEARYFIELLTEKDGFVVDPFCGGGTTAAASIRLGRKWAAFEIDEANHARASVRINETINEANYDS